MQKQVIGIDLDDVLLDLNTTMFEFHNSTYGTAHTKEQRLSFLYEDLWGCSKEEVLKRIDTFYHSDFHRNSLPVEGAVKAIRQLKENNSLVIISSKPDYLEEMTHRWVKKHFPDSFESIHFVNHFQGNGPKRSKGEVCNELGVSVFIDDSLDNVRDVARPDRQTFLFDAPWNQGETPSQVIRVHSWEEIIALLP